MAQTNECGHAGVAVLQTKLHPAGGGVVAAFEFDARAAHEPVLELLGSLATAIEESAANSEVRAAVVTGLEWLTAAYQHGPYATPAQSSNALDATAFALRGQEALSVVASAPWPVIAAVGGACLGPAFELALACDMLVAASGSTFGLDQARWGAMAAFGGLTRATRLAGPAAAKAIALTGIPMDAARAYQLGLAGQVAEPGEQVRVALALATGVARCSPAVVAASRQVIDGSAGLSMHDALRAEAAVYGRLAENEPAQAWLQAADRLRTS